MLAYLARRLAFAVFLVFAVSSASLVLAKLAPGDFAAESLGFGASPEANCAMKRSLEDGRAYTRYEGGPTLAEGLEGSVSERTYAMAKDYFPEIALVSEMSIRQAIVYAYRTLGIVCEPSAAVAIAALLDDASAIRGRRTVVLVSGGNIEPALLDQLLTGAAPVGV